MERRQELSQHSVTRWHFYPSVQRWTSGLLHVTGLTQAEVASRRDTLFQFCLLQGIDPETMAQECRKSEDRLAQRAFYLHVARQSAANLIVQSFLVHNGVNVFGDLICMPSTREQIAAEQGNQWIRDQEPSSSSSIDELESKL